MGKPQNITIYQIAERAGVSASTVSRVINNYPFVDKSTRAKVLKVLLESNYVQNESARSLVTSESRMIGILIADIRTTQHSDGVYYIEHEFLKSGYSSLIYNTGSDPEKQAKYIEMLSQRQVEATVLMGSIYQNEVVQNAIMVYMPHVPVAICNGYLDGSNIYGIISDEKSGVYDCMKLLASKGRKHFAFLSNRITPSNLLKEEGFESGFRDFVENGSTYSVLTGETSVEIKNAMYNLLRERPETDAIICAEDFMALVVLHTLAESGIAVPGKIAVVGINNSRYAEISNPALTSIDNMLYDTSLIAVRNLLEVLKGGRVNHKMIICPKIIERATT